MLRVDFVNYEEYMETCKGKIPESMLYSQKEWEDFLTEEVEEAVEGVPVGESANLSVCRNTIIYQFTCRNVGDRTVSVYFKKIMNY